MIANYNLASTPKAILESTSSTAYASVVMFFCNTSVSDSASVNVYVVPDGASPSNSNIIAKDIYVAPTDTLEFDTEKIIVDGGASIYASSNNGTVTATISYIEM